METRSDRERGRESERPRPRPRYVYVMRPNSAGTDSVCVSLCMCVGLLVVYGGKLQATALTDARQADR